MKYELRLLTLGSTSSIEISSAEHQGIKTAISGLHEVLSIEEKFDLIVENYLDLENDLMTMAIRTMVDSNVNTIELRRELNLIINRRFANLLSSCRGYLDQVAHHLSSIARLKAEGAERFPSNFKSFTSEENNICRGYRVMEALRNHTQHFGFPFSVTYDNRWLNGKDSKMANTVTPFMRLSDLEANKEFRRKKYKDVLNELKSLGRETVDAKPLIREYIASLGNIHEKVRSMLKEYVKEWEKTKRDAVIKFLQRFPHEKTTGLAAVMYQDDGRTFEQTLFVQDADDYRKTLAQRNGNLGTLPCRYVTSESISS